MVTAILALLAGLIAALPQILGFIEQAQGRKVNAHQAGAKDNVDNIDIIIPPQPPEPPAG